MGELLHGSTLWSSLTKLRQQELFRPFRVEAKLKRAGRQIGGPMRLILLIVVVILLIGALPTWPYSGGWGYYPAGGLGTILIVLLILALVGAI
jgi:Protein of unknown function (DUF3309)